MVYQVCPGGFKLVGGVCVPQSNEALMKWKSRQGKKRQPQPEPEPEPDVDPDTPEPDVDPDTPEPDVDPDTPEPDVEPDTREDFQKVDPTGMSQSEIAALLVSAGMVASGSAVRAVALGGLNVFTGSAGSTIAATSSGVGMGAAEGAEGIGVGAEGIEMTAFSVFSPANQAATDALLSGEASVTETTPLLDAGGEGIEMTGSEVIGGGTESAAAATADESAALISEGAEAASGAAEAAEAGAAAAEAGTAAAEAAGAAAEGAIIAAEGSAAVAGAAETLGTSLIVGGLVIAGTEAVIHADEVEKGIDTAVVETGEFFEDVGKTLNPFNW